MDAKIQTINGLYTHMEYNPNNIFYKIIHKQISCNIVYEDKELIAINDINPSAPVHLLIIPKSCYVSFDDFMIKNSAQGIFKLFKTVHKIAQIKNLTEEGYRIIMNHGKNASQTIMHFHIHLIGGKKISGLSSEDKYNR